MNNNHRTHVIIDTQALQHNLRQIKKRAPDAKIIAMVKANAYGHGFEQVAPIIAFNVDILGVACLQEALILRKILPKKAMLLMGGVFDCVEWPIVVENHLDVVIHCEEQLLSLLDFAGKIPSSPPLCKGERMGDLHTWIKLDTGMHRLGFRPEQLPDIYAALENCPLVQKPIGIMTHFACADDLTNPMTQNQIQRFYTAVAPFSVSPISLANSAAIIQWPEAYKTLPPTRYYVRPGIMLYGISPFSDTEGDALGLKPVMTLESRLVTIKTCYPDESVGYSSTWKASRESRIGIVATGYGDGYPRHISPNAVVWIDGHYVPIVGRVSMDFLTIDLTDFPHITTGTSVELWGKNLPVERVAAFANTSPYEIVTQVTSRPRVNFQ